MGADEVRGALLYAPRNVQKMKSDNQWSLT